MTIVRYTGRTGRLVYGDQTGTYILPRDEDVEVPESTARFLVESRKDVLLSERVTSEPALGDDGDEQGAGEEPERYPEVQALSDEELVAKAIRLSLEGPFESREVLLLAVFEALDGGAVDPEAQSVPAAPPVIEGGQD